MKIIAVGWNYRGHNAEMNQKETPQNVVQYQFQKKSFHYCYQR